VEKMKQLIKYKRWWGWFHKSGRDPCWQFVDRKWRECQQCHWAVVLRLCQAGH